MSHNIDEQIKLALEAVQAHPEHMLLPIYRRTLYNTLDPIKSAPIQSQARPWLDLFTVRYVLPLWQPILQDEVWKDYYTVPSVMVSLLEQLLQGTADKKFVKEQAAHWLEVSDLTGELESSRYYHAWCVFDAAMTALFIGLGHDYFAKTTITNSTMDTHDRYSDTANWAALAYAGGVWQPDFNQEMEYGRVEGDWNRDLDEVRDKRREFWEWWLLDAIPKACKQAQQSIG